MKINMDSAERIYGWRNLFLYKNTMSEADLYEREIDFDKIWMQIIRD